MRACLCVCVRVCLCVCACVCVVGGIRGGARGARGEVGRFRSGMVLSSVGRLALARAVHSAPRAARAATGNAQAGTEALARMARKESASDAEIFVGNLKTSLRDTGFDFGSFPTLRKKFLVDEVMRFAPFGVAGFFGILLFVRPFQDAIAKAVGLGPTGEEGEN